MMGGEFSRYFANEDGSNPLRNAFSRRSAVMPFRGRQRLASADIQPAWQGLLSAPAPPGKRLAYIHVPFCANHCLFCGFYRNAYVPDAGATYADLVVEEIRRDAAAPALQKSPIHAVYLGGGTPTALSAQELSRIIATVRAALPLAADCEITVEGRIIHFDAEKIDACLEAGANRFSIGVQSFDTAVRRRQGRRASREEAIRFLEALRDRDRAALVIDLLYGLPGQTRDIWRQDLETAAALGPDGIDLYGLNLIPGTPLATAIAAGKFPAAPGLAEIGAFYGTGADFFRRRNWRQISNNHWARTTRERNLYNLLIKEGADCLAFGAGAGGSIGRASYGIAGDLTHYSESVRAGRKPIGLLAMADGLQPLRNLVTAGFEAGRLDMAALEAIAGEGTTAFLAPLVAQWEASGLLAFSDGIVDLTVAGRFWYANLISAFHDILETRLLSAVDAA